MTYPDGPPQEPTTSLLNAEGVAADQLRDRLVSIGMDWFHNCQSLRLRQERQWHLNLAFYYGNQHVKFRRVDNGTFDLWTPNVPYYRVRLVVNQIRKIVRKEISRLTAQKPNASVVPASTEDSDVFAAQAGEQIWDSLWRKVHFNKILRQSVFWQAVCGNGFIKTYWDANKFDADSKADGDICIENVTPFHIYIPDLIAEDIELQPYVIHAQVRSNSWIKQNYNIDATSDKLDSVDDGLLSVMNVNRSDGKKEQGIVLEIWIKPGSLPELPRGGMITIAANKFVQGYDYWPYEHGQYPFAKLDAMPTGKFYNASIVEDMIPLQQELNRSRSQLIESKNRMSKPQLVAQKGSIDPKMITTEPGQVILYNPGMEPPQPLPLQNLPSYVTEEINRLYDDLADISGQHEVSNGSTPPGVTAATAISFLQEQDESLIAGQYSSIEEAVEKIASQSLWFVKMFWDKPRTIKVAGLEGTFDVRMFRDSDLRGNTDIRVESGSALPTSRAAKQAFIMDLMKMGFVNPDEGLEILEVGGLQKIYERVRVDKRQAQRENLLMRVATEEDIKQHQEAWMQQNPEVQRDIDAGLNLEPPLIVSVNTYDNHEVHIAVHNSFRKGQSFESADSITKILFEEHVRQHQDALAGMMTHPLTGMDPSNPNAPDPADEEALMQQQDQQSGTTGPEPIPALSDEQPQEGVIA